MLKIAVAKGRIESKFFKILENAGVKMQKAGDRALQLWDVDNKFQFAPIKASDVPVYVETGAFNIGIVGMDSVWEADKNVYELLDLGFSSCKMCVAGKNDEKSKKDYFQKKPMALATKYVNIAGRLFVDDNITDIIHLSGSVEIAPLQGLAPIIFDIVETGVTLRENNLVVYEEKLECSAIVIANKMSLKTMKEEIDEFIELLKKEIK